MRGDQGFNAKLGRKRTGHDGRLAVGLKKGEVIMAEVLIGEKTAEIRVTAPSVLVAEEKLKALLKPAGLAPDRMRCEMKLLTADGEWSFSFSGRVKLLNQDKGD